MTRTQINNNWTFALDEHIRDRSVTWTGWEHSLLGFDSVSGTDDCVNWLKAGRCYGPATPSFDDSSWRAVDLPHDWSVESTPRPEDHPRNGFHRAGVGWYRRTLTLTADQIGNERRVALRFDGIFRDATVFVNGHLVGQNRSGYIGFVCDISDVVEPGDNVIAVRVNATAKEGWFYEGAGIYRHVWLVTSGRVRMLDDGLRVDTRIDGIGTASLSTAIDASVELINDTNNPTDAVATLVIRNWSNTVVARAEQRAPLGPGETRELRFDTLTLDNPRLWSLDDRSRYTASVETCVGNKSSDHVEQRFGLRTIRFDADHGFFLNEQPVKLKGVCSHQDHAGVGCAIPDALQRWRLERLVEMGCNAIRTAHNPPTPEMLDLCDELGILVMDEIRCFGTSEEAISQLVRMVRRDRHHPSVIMWSLANEEMAVHASDVGHRMYATLKRIARQHDISRPFTAGVNNDWDKPNGFIEAEDVHGINYLPNGSLDTLRANRPDLPIVIAEASSAISTRGEYVTDPAAGTVHEYDDHTEPQHEHVVNWPFWGQAAELSWKIVAAKDFIAGTFVWTSFDYRGEQSPYVRWPSVGSHFGILDLCGFPKDRFYYYKAWWSSEDVLHVFPHWTWPGREGEIIDVWVYSNCPRVELLLNGESLGTREIEPNGHAEWKVEYRPGTLEAIGHTAAGIELRRRVETVGPPHAIRLRSDRHAYRFDGHDVAVVTAEVVDAHGRLAPHAANALRFELDGPARIIGLGNGDPNSHEPDTPQRGVGVRRAFHGLVQVLVRIADTSVGSVLRATADGLHSAELVLAGERQETASSEPPNRTKSIMEHKS
ncbi:MAG: glycoside hydrolase family 2 TIM barrel-domain containing protein [Planctomycetota bacterium]